MSRLRNKIYYSFKPFIPTSLRAAVRRQLATRLRRDVGDVWPIMPGSERSPADWPGWPDGKKFAFVLTHDVESESGVRKCRQLAAIEQKFGFRSSFNFIPEGSYRVPDELRRNLSDIGFEVGVHDLKHDGRLYTSRREFSRNASRINQYLARWDAVGFRSGFMLHNLDWLHQLNVEYDMSTFDTDPFEPQPEGKNTIFPVWVPAADGSNGDPVGNAKREGYLELPYTLPQDSTLFLLLGERTSDIWKRKLDWLALHGGMALVNIHPDYIDFDSGGNRHLYPSARVEDLLEHVAERFEGQFWNPCPRELAAWYKSNRAASYRPRLNGAVAHPPRRTSQQFAGKRTAVLLYSYYPSDPRPRRAAEALAADGMAVDLVCLRDEGQSRSEMVNGVRVVRCQMRRRRGNKLVYVLQYLTFFTASFLFLTRHALVRRYDLVHVHNMPDWLVFAAIVPKLLGAKVLLDLHDPMPELMTSIYGSSPDAWPIRLLRLVEKWSIAFADLVLTPNLAFKSLFVSRSCTPEKMQIVMNSPEEMIFKPAEEREERRRIEDVPFRIMHHGSIVHRHGIDLLVKALPTVCAAITGAQLDIYGSRTHYLDDVLRLAEEIGVSDRVHYRGQRPQVEIAAAIQRCDVGVVPNRRSPFTEINFPTRLFEYLAMQRPVIAPATKGIRDYFGPDELITFDPGDEGDLAAKIIWVALHPEEAQRQVERGFQVYQRNLWQQEKARFVGYVGDLVRAA